MEETTQQQEQPVEVNLVVNAVAGKLNRQTNKVTLNEKVDPVFIVEEALMALQAANKKVEELEKKLADLQPKEEPVKDI